MSTIWQKARKLSQQRIHDYPRDLPPRSVIKASGLMMVGPTMLLIVLVFYGHITIEVAFWSATFLFCISLIFIFPYLTNLTALRGYVKALAKDEYADAPDLKFLSVVEDLQSAVEEHHIQWQRRGGQLQATLHESQILINSLPDIIILIDKNLKLIRTNTTAKQVFGRTDYRETVDSILDDHALRDSARHALKNNSGATSYYQLGAPYNNHYLIRIEPFPKKSSSNIAALIILHDITDQKQTEQLFADFVANASHEIRTPLTSIQGYIETLQTSAKDDKKAQAKFLTTMAQQANRMSALVNDLLSLSNIERMLRSQPTDKCCLNQLTKDVIKQLKPTAKESNIKLIFSSNKDLPKALGDNNQLHQVIENILSNAIKYSPSNTEISLTLQANQDLPAEIAKPSRTKNWLSLTITDQGIGIPKADIPRLTERFYRVDKGRSRSIGGNGLGLSIVAQILQRHQAHLDIQSTPNKGSSFTIYFKKPSQ